MSAMNALRMPLSLVCGWLDSADGWDVFAGEWDTALKEHPRIEYLKATKHPR